MNSNTAKFRKSKAQKQFEELESMGRFAGENTDAKAAREQAVEQVRQDTQSTRKERDK